MKNLNPLICSQILEFDLIKDSKRNPTRSNLTLLRPSVDANYNYYLTNFQNIHTIGNLGYSLAQNEDLKKCYTISTNALSNLIGRIIKAQSIELQYICAYCLFHTVTTIDHHVPEGEFPVFCVMPQNLLPCCFRCNGIKNEYWRNAGLSSRLFIHFYNDPIPNLIFLSGSLALNNGIPRISYTLSQPPGMTNAFYSILQTHFQKLELLNLYAENIGVVIGEIKKSVISARAANPAITIADISRVLLATSQAKKHDFGINYWQSIATDLLAMSQPFLSSL
jgi:hypothetical protein